MHTPSERRARACCVHCHWCDGMHGACTMTTCTCTCTCTCHGVTRHQKDATPSKPMAGAGVHVHTCVHDTIVPNVASVRKHTHT